MRLGKKKNGEKQKKEKLHKPKKKIKKEKSSKISNIASKFKFLENMSLNKQLISAFILILCIPITIITSYSYFGTRNALTEKVNELNTQATSLMGSNLDNYLTKLKDITLRVYKDKGIRKAIESYNTDISEEEIAKNEVAIRNYMTAIVGEGGLREAFVVYDNNEWIGKMETGVLTKLASEGELFDAIKTTDKLGVSFITGLNDSYDVIFQVRKINDSAMLVVGQSPELLANVFRSSVDTEYQEVNIVNEENEVMYSTNKENIGMKVKDEWAERLKETEGEFSHEESLVTFVTKSGFKLTNSVTKNYIFKEINDINKKIVYISLVCVIVALLIAIVIAGKIVKPIANLVGLMKKVEEGNFTVESEYKAKNELGVLSNSFNIMTKNVKSLIGNVIEVSDGIHIKVDNIKSISKNSTVAAQQVSEAIEEIAVGASDQAKQAEETLITIRSLAKSINEVTGSIDVVSESSDNTKEIGNGSLMKVKELEQKTVETDKTLNEITNTVITLVASLKNIESFLEVINSISNQTNLLAINASIEAAHAGEYGKGFSVVAGEVKKLADQSKESTEEIAKVIKTIQIQTNDVNKLINESSKIFKEQKVAVDYTSESFKDILLATDEITKEVESVQELVSGMNKYKENSMNAIKSISTVAEESSATTEEVMASTQEQAYLSTELESLTENLYKEVNSLRSAIDKFKV